MDQPGSSARASLAASAQVEHEPTQQHEVQDDESAIAHNVFLAECLDPLPPLPPLGLPPLPVKSAAWPSGVNVAESSQISNGHSDGNTSVEDNFYNRATKQFQQEPDSKVMHELVLNYLITEGMGDVARALCEDAEMEFPEEFAESMNQRMEIRTAIVGDGDMAKARGLVEAFAPDSAESDRELRFRLDQQHIIELIRNNNLEEALALGAPSMENAEKLGVPFQQEMERTFALMAFEDPSSSQFAKLMELEHRKLVANYVNTAVLKATDQESISRLESCLQLMVYFKRQAELHANSRGLSSLLVQGTGATREEQEIAIAEKMFGSGADDQE